MEVGCQGTWGLALPTLTQVARTPQKPALPATQPRAPPTLPEDLQVDPARSDGGLWPISHSLQGSRPEAPNPSSKKGRKHHTVHTTPIDRKPG